MDVVYHDIRSPGSFGGIDRLWRHSNKRRKDVVDYLKSQDAYTLHKPIRRRFIRRSTYSKGIGDLYQIDLANLSNLSTYSNGYRYLLNCIDVFFEKSMVIAAKIKEQSRSDRGIRTDTLRPAVQHGPVGQGYRVRQLDISVDATSLGHKFYTSENEDIKAAIVERFNRTLKEKMYRYLRRKTLADTSTFCQISYTHTIAVVIDR